MSTATDSGTDAGGRSPMSTSLCALLNSVSGMTAMLIGAITVVATEEIMEFVDYGGAVDVLITFPVVLALLWGQVLAVLAWRRWRV